MKTQNLIRWSGLALLAAGILDLAGVFHPPDTVEGVMSPAWAPVHYVYAVQSVLLVFGLIGLYAYQAEKGGRLALIAFVLASAGNAMGPGLALVEAGLWPTLAANPATQSLANLQQGGTFGIVLLVSGVVALVGFILFGIAIMRAGVLPRWAGLSILLGWVLVFFSLGLPALAIIRPIGSVLAGLGFAWCGYAIWTAKGEMTMQPKPAM